MRRQFIFLVIFVIYFGYLQKVGAQNYMDDHFISVRAHSGMIINNYIYFDSFPKRKPSALLEIKFGKQTVGTKSWQQFYGFPQIGVSAIGGYLGNTGQFGYMVGVLPNVTLNTRNHKKWSVKIRMGLGLSYFNKPFDSISNPYNILIGSHLTALAMTELYFQKRVTKRLNFEFGMSVVHASNGHTGLPNVGLNMVNLNAGLKHYFDDQTEEFNQSNKIISNKRLKYIVRLGMGTHKFGNELGPPNSPSYPVYDFALFAGRSVGKLGSAYAGLGYKYYTSFYYKILEGDLYEEKLHLKSSVFTLLLAYEFEMGQMSFLVQGGINVYNPFWPEFKRLIDEEMTFYKKIEGLISTRLGLQYYFFDKEKFDNNIYLGLYIKANMGGADFVSLSTGFMF
ncbi:MAG: acyloxyacyl hydrolase [Bacteroidota bacterium]